MSLNSHPYSYLAISDLFRNWYRAGYMKQLQRYHEDKDFGDEWPELTFSLKGILKDDAPDKEIIDRSMVVVMFKDLSTEIWAANLVYVMPNGVRWGVITINKTLYREIVGAREEAEKRKFILAHEWLEVLHTLCNYSFSENGRAIAGKAEMYALMGATEVGLPWQDSEEHLARMVPGLRDLLVSKHTILRLSRESRVVDNHDHLETRFVQILREQGRGAAINFLVKFAEEISIKVNVARPLVQSRIQEMLKMPSLSGAAY